MFDTILIANRGEIAVRIISTLRRMGIRTVAVYSDADVHARHVREADISVNIGPAAARESYLSVPKIMDAVAATGAQAVHPGYGFLSENVELARACASQGVTFIGPPASALELMGDKIRAKQTVSVAGVRVVPGRAEPGMSDTDLVDAVEQIGYPVLLKPSAGGGGKGMRLVTDQSGLTTSIESARREARNAFGDDTLFVERYVSSPRHIEIQVLGDEYGTVVHLGERECSLQRRHQKVVEEAPSPLLNDGLRALMGQAAVDAAKAVGYTSTGTVEFIVSTDAPEDFYFMEMNTRLQVEHAVTELITGLDLVEQQVKIAAGQALSFTQQDVQFTGHAIEARIYAEDPTQGFLPTGGRILIAREPTDLVRVDSALVDGLEVGSDYDPMLAKYIAYGENREQSLNKLRFALSQATILGVTTNIPFLSSLLADDDVQNGNLDTGLIERKLAQLTTIETPEHVFVAAAMTKMLRSQKNKSTDPWDLKTSWRIGEPGWSTLRFTSRDGAPTTVRIRDTTGNAEVIVNDSPIKIAKAVLSDIEITLEYNGTTNRYSYAENKDTLWIGLAGTTWALHEADLSPASSTSLNISGAGPITSPMPGTVSAVAVEVGDIVTAGQALFVVEAMKMEHAITANADGRVTELSAHVGQQVRLGQPLAMITSMQSKE